MQKPLVSFVVPCYRLASLLPECVASILSQTFEDFEIIIMDDCSPDNTEEIAKAFTDSRVIYIRNEQNLGALRNYNKGIRSSRGKYIWLISADDCLRQPYILQRYVETLENHPEVGFAFCPGVSLKGGKEGGVISYSTYGDIDTIARGENIIKRLSNGNMILAASVLVRRDCYEKLSLFPIDVVWAGIPVDFIWGGDWYLWLLFSLNYDVAYFAEPMVCYREHELSMTNTITRERIDSCWHSELAVITMISQAAKEKGALRVYWACLGALADFYAKHCASKSYEWMGQTSWSTIDLEQVESTLDRSPYTEQEKAWIRSRIMVALADLYYSKNDYVSARSYYLKGLKLKPFMLPVFLKLIFLSFGDPGRRIRGFLRAVRNNPRPWMRAPF
jgi:glycosyltransferase involved in cell wall biosynthesis